MKKQMEAYRHADTMGKSPLELVLMVYDGAIKAMRAAAEHYAVNKNQAGYEEIQTAKRMVTHLYTTLDREKGGEVTEHLGKMYTWVISQLYILEATKNVDQLDKTIQVMVNLRSGWETLRTQAPRGNDKAEKAATEETPDHVMVTA